MAHQLILITLSAPRRFTSRISYEGSEGPSSSLSPSSSEAGISSRNGLVSRIPALAKTMSTLPPWCSSEIKADLVAAQSETLHGMKPMRGDLCLCLWDDGGGGGGGDGGEEMSRMCTCAPRRARSWAVAQPMPLAPPRIEKNYEIRFFFQACIR